MTHQEELLPLLQQLAANSIAADVMVSAAESCTGGMIAAAMTELAGSSAWFDRGFVTYSNEAKQDMLGVSRETIDTHGAVSHETVEAMVCGALQRSRASVAVAVSGVAGPAGGSADKPVGTVFLGLANSAGMLRVEHLLLDGSRSAIREATVLAAVRGLIECSKSL